MLKFKKIALTGSLASGKTTVLQQLAALGATTLSADAIGHRLLESNPAVQEVIKKNFGTLDRGIIADQVFKSRDKLNTLEKTLHPLIRDEIEREYQKTSHFPFVVEIALLYECGWENDYDGVIAVLCPPQLCEQRWGNAADYARRMARQLPPEEKAKRATWVLDNSTTREALNQQVSELMKTLKESHGTGQTSP